VLEGMGYARAKVFLLRGLIVIFFMTLLSSCEQENSVTDAIKTKLRAAITEVTPRKSERYIAMEAGVKVTKDFLYGTHKKQRLDIYAPLNANSAPIIMMLHGGGWASGDKGERLSYINKVNRWVPKGFIVISVGTRLLPEANVYDQVDDLAQAVVNVQNNAAKWGGDGRKLILMGHSSAGTMVSALAANPTTVTHLGGDKWLASIALDSTSLDISRSMRLWAPGMIARAYGEEPNRWLDASPISLLSHASIPMLLVCSTQRGDGPCEQAELFAKEAEKFEITTKIIPQNYDHGGVDFNLGLDVDYTQSVERFMASLDAEVSRLLARTITN